MVYSLDDPLNGSGIDNWTELKLFCEQVDNHFKFYTDFGCGKGCFTWNYIMWQRSKNIYTNWEFFRRNHMYDITGLEKDEIKKQLSDEAKNIREIQENTCIRWPCREEITIIDNFDFNNYIDVGKLLLSSNSIDLIDLSYYILNINFSLKCEGSKEISILAIYVSISSWIKIVNLEIRSINLSHAKVDFTERAKAFNDVKFKLTPWDHVLFREDTNILSEFEPMICFYKCRIGDIINPQVRETDIVFLFFKCKVNKNIKYCQNEYVWYIFNKCTFNKEFLVEDINIVKPLIIQECKFKNKVSFNGSTFEKDVSFRGSKFCKAPYLEADPESNELVTPSFINTTFKQGVSFREVTFETPPHFEGAESDIVTFEGAKFYNFFDGVESAEEKGKIFYRKKLFLATRAWAALIQLAAHVGDTERYYEFQQHLLEVEKRFQSQRRYRSLYSIFLLYGAGRSVWKPFFALIACSVIVALFLAEAYVCVQPGMCVWSDMGKAFNHVDRNIVEDAASMISHHTTLFVPQPKGMLQNLLNAFEANSYFSYAVGALRYFQTIHSLFCFFLIGLALRNRFRVKA